MDGTYVQHINKAFAAAAAALMELMTGREGLPDMLQAFKSYFLLARGDLFTTFLDLAENELERNATDVTVTRLQSLLELGRLSPSIVGPLWKTCLACSHSMLSPSMTWEKPPSSYSVPLQPAYMLGDIEHQKQD